MSDPTAYINAICQRISLRTYCIRCLLNLRTRQKHQDADTLAEESRDQG